MNQHPASEWSFLFLTTLPETRKCNWKFLYLKKFQEKYLQNKLVKWTEGEGIPYEWFDIRDGWQRADKG